MGNKNLLILNVIHFIGLLLITFIATAILAFSCLIAAGIFSNVIFVYIIIGMIALTIIVGGILIFEQIGIFIYNFIDSLKEPIPETLNDSLSDSLSPDREQSPEKKIPEEDLKRNLIALGEKIDLEGRKTVDSSNHLDSSFQDEQDNEILDKNKK